jgi:hypothetical protein
VGEVIATAATTGDQARISASRERANQVASVTISAEPRGGSDLDENQWCVLIEPPIPGEELAQF